MPAASSPMAAEPKPICHIVTPVGMLGYGFDETLTAQTVARLLPSGVPVAIILDSGSTDSGPGKLALGDMTCPRYAYLKDLRKLCRLVHMFVVPLIFSSAGGDGTDEHVEVMKGVIKEICADEENKDYRFNTISIFSGIAKRIVLSRLEEGKITPCGDCVPTLTVSDIDLSPRIVAQLGPEPFVEAMEANPDFDIVIGGRAYDPAPYVAYCTFQLKRQYPGLSSDDITERYGGFVHMGKIMECGGQCSTPKSHGAVATVYSDGVFEVRPTALDSYCTPYSVAAHTLYENTRPDILKGPGGALHLEDARYEQLQDGRSVRVRGSKFRPSKADGRPYQFKLEAARVAGYRSLFMGSIRDHVLIGQMDDLTKRVRQYVDLQHPDLKGTWALDFHTYGKGQTTPNGPGEIFIVAEALAPTQELATSIAAKARIGMIHGPYPGQKATSGNFGFGIGGLMQIEAGPCAEFSIYHLMDLEVGEERLQSDKNTLTEHPVQNGVGIEISTAQELSGVGQGRKGPLIRSSIAVIGRGQPLLALPKQSYINGVSTAKHRGVPAGAPSTPKTLSDLCNVLRSKNAGPFEVTLDAIFSSQDIYDQVKASDLLTKENVARALDIPEDQIVWSGFYDPALAFKVTIPRLRDGKMVAAGGFMENDIHGSQQHLGLATLKLSEDLINDLKRDAVA